MLYLQRYIILPKVTKLLLVNITKFTIFNPIQSLKLNRFHFIIKRTAFSLHKQNQLAKTKKRQKEKDVRKQTTN